MVSFLVFINLTAQTLFWIGLPCDTNQTAQQCIVAAPWDAGAVSAPGQLIIRAAGPPGLLDNATFGTINIVLSFNGNARPVDNVAMTGDGRNLTADNTFQEKCFEQSIENGALDRKLAGDYESRLICMRPLS